VAGTVTSVVPEWKVWAIAYTPATRRRATHAGTSHREVRSGHECMRISRVSLRSILAPARSFVLIFLLLSGKK
jgi:hypothetical protein